ncbi:hypothetical protein [Escherichia coli]|uniref:hypothetical protein n=1 Tax=Escherichia coli TaxID=562 RepID=UPI003570F32E
MFAYLVTEKLPRFACLLPARCQQKQAAAPGESGFTVTMRLTVQPSGSAFMHESSGTVAPIIDVSGRSDNFR